MTTRYVAPFEIQPIEKFTQRELERRERDYGFEFVKADKAGWDDNGNWKNYKGPLTCWVRVCSNGIGDDGKEGFVMHGVNGFYKDYGFDPLTKEGTETVLGFTAAGDVHSIKGEYGSDGKSINKHVPPPGIVSVDAVMQKSMYRQVTIKWKCHSKEHLNYMTPYFMSPSVTMFIEWGWNHFNPDCLLNLMDIGAPAIMKASMDDKTPGPPGNPKDPKSGDPDDPRLTAGTGLLGLYTDPLLQQSWIEKGQGLYELTCGIISSFEYSLQADGSYDCTTEVKSNSFIYSGVQTRSNAIATTSADAKGNKKPEPVKGFRGFVKNDFKKIAALVLDNVDKKDPQFVTPGWPNPETRIFIPRNTDVGKDPRTKYLSVSTYSFDRNGSDDFWISMGLFVDLINKYCSADSTATGAIFNYIDIQSSWIGGHKNLISTNGKVLLIPNSQAPNISPDAQDRGNSTLYRTPKTQIISNPTPDKSTADITLDSLFKGAVRQDLDEVINYFRHEYGRLNSGGNKFKTIDKKYTEFPSSEYKYFLGKLENLYIHKDIVVESVEKSETVTDILNYVLNKISEAVGGFWKFNLIQYGPSNSLLSIIDTDAISVQRLQELGSDKQPYLYYFKNRASKNTIQTLNFSVKLSDKVGTMVMFNSKDDKKIMVPMKNTFGFVTRDRFFSRTTDASYLTPRDRQILETHNQDEAKERDRLDGVRASLLEKEKDTTDGAFIYGEVDKDNESRTYIRKLALTQKDLLTLLLNDRDALNTSINSFPQPGIKAELTLLGLAGFRTFQIFGIDNLPAPYDKDILFQVEDVKHSLQASGMWTTTITADIRPIRGLNVKV